MSFFKNIYLFIYLFTSSLMTRRPTILTRGSGVAERPRVGLCLVNWL